MRPTLQNDKTSALLAKSGVIALLVISASLFLYPLFWQKPHEARAADAAVDLSPPFPVALRTLGVWNENNKERVDLTVWYPGTLKRGTVQIEGHILRAMKNGKPLAGFFPIILMSHDSTGSRFANHDLAARLAEGGFVVIAPTHTGDSIYNSANLFTADNILERPRDLLVALEAVLDFPDLANIADESRIGIVGSGFGAITAMQMAGARPDFAKISGLCLESRYEPLCAPWSRERLEKIPAGLDVYEQSLGNSACCPDLAFYAPRLVEAPNDERHEQSDENVKKLLQILSPPQKTDTTQPALPAAQNSELSAGQLVDYAHIFPYFQPDNLIGDPKKAAVYRSPLALQADHDKEAGKAGAGKKPPAKPAPKKARHRPANVRSLKAIALLNPAGGAFFSKEALADVRQYIAIVQAENDEIYPVKTHSTPYMDNLPTPPSLLSIKKSDHYSLFALCPEHVKGVLEQNCGKVTPYERQDMVEARDQFMVMFFQSILGTPYPTPPETNLIIAPTPESEQ